MRASWSRGPAPTRRRRTPSSFMVLTISSERISNRAGNAGLPTGDQPIEVGTPDQREPSPEGDRRNDVSAGHDARIDHDLGVRADLTYRLWKEVERHRCPVQLPTAVGSTARRRRRQLDTPLGVVEGLQPLHHDLARPGLLDPAKVVEVDRWVEHRVEQVSDRAVESREPQRLGREEVDPPPDPRDRTRDRGTAGRTRTGSSRGRSRSVWPLRAPAARS